MLPVLTPQVTMETQVSLAHYGPWAVDVAVLKRPHDQAIQADQVVAQVDMQVSQVVPALLVKDLVAVRVQVLEMAVVVALVEQVVTAIMLMVVTANFSHNLHL